MAHKAGFVNIIGEPNAGKSTLLNALLGEAWAVVNPKAQTTRHRIRGILNGDGFQMVISDTPGILEPQYELQKSMMRAINEVVEDADVLVLITAVDRNPVQQPRVLERMLQFKGHRLVLINKVDMTRQEAWEHAVEQWHRAIPEAEILPISALHGLHIDALRKRLIEMLPDSPAYFPDDQISDRPMRFFVAEVIRGQILDLYHQEVPYSTEVVVNGYQEEEKMVRIQAEIMVARDTQKGILIGKGGTALRQLSTRSRKALSTLVGKDVFLELFVKVDKDWRTDKSKLKRYGYE